MVRLALFMMALLSFALTQSGTLAQSGPAMLSAATQAITWFGADPVGVVDSSAALARCMAAVGDSGGVCRLSNGRFLLSPAASSTVTIAAHVTLACETGNPGPGNQGGRYNSQAAILLPASKTLQFEAGSGIDGCLIMRSDLVVPAADSSGFAGTAISVAGGDVHLRDTLILGFDRCLVAHGVDRLVIDGLSGDCQSGLSLSESYDSARLRGLHFWPYVTIGYNAGKPPASSLIRSGVGLAIFGRNDDTFVEDAMVFGYQTNVLVGGPDGNTGNIGFGSVWADDPAAQRATPSVCMNVAGAYDNVFITRLWAWSCGGLQVNAGLPGFRLHIGQYFASTNNGDGLDVNNGTTFIDHADISSSKGKFAVGYNAAVATLDIGQLNLHDLATISQPAPVGVVPGSTTDKLRLHNVSYDQSKGPELYEGVLSAPSIASAPRIAVPPSTVSDFLITGTSRIARIDGPWDGREITLRFTAAASIAASGGNISLVGGDLFVARAGSLMRLIYHAATARWIEAFRRF